MSSSTTPPACVRIVMLGAFPPQSQGVMDYCGELAQALAERYDVTAIGYRAMYPALLYPGEKTRVDGTKPKLEAAHLRVHHPLTYYNPWTWLRAAISSRADVFHVQWWSLPLWAVSLVMMIVMRLRGKVVVVTLHNVLPHGRSRLFVPASRLLCRLAHRVVVHSEQNRQQLHDHYRLPEGKTHQVPHGVFFSKVKQLDAQNSKRGLGLEKRDQVILLYGALRAYKGIDVLLRAFAELADVHHRVQLVIAGKLWLDWAPFARIIDDHSLGERVHVFPEFVPEERVPVFFSAADLVVLPYTSFDAQSGVAATALPYGKPMIVTRTGGLPECVADDERWIVTPGQVAPLARRLVAFFDDTGEQTKAFADVADRVLRSYSWESVVEAYRPIYRCEPASGVER